MSRLFYHTMQDNLGNLLFGVSGTMRIAGTSTFATIYGDEALTVILPNPMTNHPSFGSFKCFLPSGDFDFYMAKPGYTFETLTGVQGHGTMAQQDANNVAITGGSALGLGLGQVANLGLGRIPDVNYVLATAGGPSYFNGEVAIGRVPNPAFSLVVGNLPSHFDTAVTVVGQLTASNVAIAGGTAVLGNTQIANLGLGRAPDPSYLLAVGAGASYFTGNLGIGRVPNPSYSLAVGNLPSHFDTAVTVAATLNATNAAIVTNLTNNGATYLQGMAALGPGAAQSNVRLYVWYKQASHAGLLFQPDDNDTGAFSAVIFQNTGGVEVGSIKTTGAATAFNTASDSRLKTAITPLTGALDVVRALKPVSHRWRADDSPGVSFLAHEVQEVIPDGVITGDKDAVDEAGGIIPQMIDYGKLVPWLVSAVKELTQQVEMLQAQLEGARA